MSVQECGLKLIKLSTYASHMVDDPRSQMSKFLFGVSNLGKTKCRMLCCYGYGYLQTNDSCKTG